MAIDYVHYYVIFKILSQKTENLLTQKIIQCNEYSSIKKKEKGEINIRY